MAPWQPPIPQGALYSKPARELGAALPLLAYCYDQIERDGWFTLSLKDAAGEMDESYQTIKRYWWALKAGPFFCETIDRGRYGWRIRFKDVWIDWRILNNRSPDDRFSRSDEGTKTDLEAPNTGAQGHVKVTSRSDEGTKSDPQSNVYGTHDSDQADLPPPPMTQPPRESGGGGGGARDPQLESLRSLFSQLQITNADRLATTYRAEYPQVTLQQVVAYVAEIASDCEKDPAHRGSRYYRKLKDGIPVPLNIPGGSHGPIQQRAQQHQPRARWQSDTSYDESL